MQPSSHTIHDNRLLVVHPASMKAPCLGLLVALNYRIRLFAPIQSPQHRNNTRAYLNQYPSANSSMRRHYGKTVFENMSALFLELEGGAKRMLMARGAELSHDKKTRRAIKVKERGWRFAWTARSKRIRVWNPALAVTQTKSRPWPNWIRENALDLSQRTPRQMFKIIFPWTCTISCKHNPNTKRA